MFEKVISMSNFNGGKLNINDIINKMKQGNNTPASEDDVNDFINSNLSGSQADTVRDILKDEERTKALLNSDAAKELFVKFFGGKNNG
jgi:hypothetical protein